MSNIIQLFPKKVKKSPKSKIETAEPAKKRGRKKASAKETIEHIPLASVTSLKTAAKRNADNLARLAKEREQMNLAVMKTYKIKCKTDTEAKAKPGKGTRNEL